MGGSELTPTHPGIVSGWAGGDSRSVGHKRYGFRVFLPSHSTCRTPRESPPRPLGLRELNAEGGPRKVRGLVGLITAAAA
eukprot:2819548-Pyramimonas_sp.AAC.1